LSAKSITVEQTKSISSCFARANPACVPGQNPVFLKYWLVIALWFGLILASSDRAQRLARHESSSVGSMAFPHASKQTVEAR
jgi:hypothetical protein